jgi:alkyl hydroperoxide reductase subunit AhpC
VAAVTLTSYEKLWEKHLTMRHVGERALTFRLAAIDERGLTVIEPHAYMGRWVVLSFVPGVEESVAALWNEQGRHLKASGGALLLVLLGAKALHDTECRPGAEHFTIVGDPLGRLERLYGARTLLSTGTARTFLIDPAGVLRFHLVHSLSERGMGLISELLETYQADEVPA